MSASPDDQAAVPPPGAESPKPEPERSDRPGTDQEPPPSQAAPASAASDGAADAAASAPPPRNLLLYTVFTLLCIAITLWLIFAWSGYRDKYAQKTEGWHLGETKMIEITLVREDKHNLACASDRVIGGVHCGFRANTRPFGTALEQNPRILQPYNTVRNELFLGAGLWQSPALQGPLPATRFTVVCNYHVAGVLRDVSLRWSKTGSFAPVDQSEAVGTLADSLIPQRPAPRSGCRSRPCARPCAQSSRSCAGPGRPCRLRSAG